MIDLQHSLFADREFLLWLNSCYIARSHGPLFKLQMKRFDNIHSLLTAFWRVAFFSCNVLIIVGRDVLEYRMAQKVTHYHDSSLNRIKVRLYG